MEVTDDPLTSYKLSATVWHAGSHASSGHYIADVRKPSKAGASSSKGGGGGAGAAAAATADDWQRFDDSFVRTISSTDMMKDAKNKGYIYFFVHSSLVDLS